jgi:hypothetical protein
MFLSAGRPPSGFETSTSPPIPTNLPQVVGLIGNQNGDDDEDEDGMGRDRTDSENYPV